ncbi:MAG: DUF255 domain-containing protein [bacterium]|nr:DUF255 domain-containing protein [bacterium]
MTKSFSTSLFVLFAAVSLAGIMMAFQTTENQPKPKTQKTSTKGKAKSKTTAKKTAEVNNDSTLRWYSPTEGYAKAKKENKILVVDVYTDWCYWCKVMDKETYTKMDIILKMNQYFVAVKFNPEIAATHTINGQQLSSDALLSLLNNGGRNSGYPTTFFWKELTDNSKASSYPGYREPTGFNDILNSWINK